MTKPPHQIVWYSFALVSVEVEEKEVQNSENSILASSKNVYLIESKWDNLSQNQEVKIELSNVQILRHEIFSWYFMNWSAQQYRNWGEFSNALQNGFMSKFPSRKIAPDKSILARNLEFVLSKLHEYCEKGKEPKNVL